VRARSDSYKALSLLAVMFSSDFVGAHLPIELEPNVRRPDIMNKYYVQIGYRFLPFLVCFNLVLLMLDVRSRANMCV
jgi:hypothetical protein